MPEVKIHNNEIFYADQLIGRIHRKREGNPGILIFPAFYEGYGLRLDQVHEIGRETHQKLYDGLNETLVAKGIGNYYHIELVLEVRANDTRKLDERFRLKSFNNEAIERTVITFVDEFIKCMNAKLLLMGPQSEVSEATALKPVRRGLLSRLAFWRRPNP